ncbi:MAG: serine hydrolase [Caulobacteraceae bacterium]|nr:serine hydrolase [Caulobacteraceae bacterium]
MSNPDPSFPTDSARQIDGIVEDAISAYTAPGYAVGVSRHGKPLFTKAYGLANLECATPTAVESVFRIGSMTKQFTAVAILVLADQGRLSIDDTLALFLPEFPRATEVTLRQLLNHTSGLHNYTEYLTFQAFSRVDRSTSDMVEHIAGLSPLYDFDPGTAWNYSNSGYYLLGAVVEQVAKVSYGAFLRTAVLDPLSLHDTAFDAAEDVVPYRASGYDAAPTSTSRYCNTGFTSESVAGAAGALRSTVGDLLRWHAALQGGKLISPTALTEMTTPAKLKNGQMTSTNSRWPRTGRPYEYGFGLYIQSSEGKDRFGHGGSINGFNCSMLTYPQSGTTIVILANANGASDAVVEAVTEAVLGSSPSKP